MSDYAFVADRAKKAFASVARLESALAKRPDDRGLAINLVSTRKLASQAREELERLAKINQIEVCEYRLVPATGDYGLGHVAESMLEYQNLFTQIYDAFKNGIKERANFGRDAEHESMLDFAYSFSGSLGIVLLAKSERTFFSGNLDRSIEALYQILDISDVDSVRDIARALGRAVVKRVHDWSKANVDGGFATDIQWRRSDGRLLGQMVDQRRLQRIVEYISATADEKTLPHDITGILVGGNVETRTFQITIPNGETYAGHMAPDAALPAELTLGRTYNAIIDVSETYFFATERTVTTNRLKRLIGPLG